MDLIGPLFLAAVRLIALIAWSGKGAGRWEKGEGGREWLWSFIPQPHPRRKKKWGKRKVEKEGGVERGDVVFGILKPNFKVDMRIGG